MKTKYTLIFGVLAWLFCALAARAEDPLKSIDEPDGGRIVYGQVTGQTTVAGAMQAVLGSIQNYWGDQPQVGRYFRVHGTNSIAAFLTGVNHSKGDIPLAGMVIVTQVSPDSVEAALLTDDPQRLVGTLNPMLTHLLKVWRPGAAPQQASAADDTASAPAASLNQYVLPDRSAAASLPDGWEVSPSSGYGTIIASGPNGEHVQLGFCIRAFNSNNPQVQRTMQWAQGPGRNTIYGRSIYYPYGGDMAKTFVDLIQLYREKQGLQPVQFQIASVTDLPAPSGWRRVHITGLLDAGDGFGTREFNNVFCCAPPGPAGGFMTYLDASSVPVRFAEQERNTMVAIMSSFRVDQSLVSQQAAAIAAPEIARIHEIGRRAAQQAADAHAAEDAQNAAVENHWAAEDKQSEAFGNYLLDQSIVRDSETGTRSTEWNQTADAMVRSNPGRYEYVNP
jgi:hypothetical protein